MTQPVYKASSPYRDTPFRDFYLDLWDGITFPASPDDQRITIEARHEGRPDLLAFELYGSPNFWWVFSVSNPDILIDPVEDFRAGTQIRAPQETAVLRGAAR